MSALALDAAHLPSIMSIGALYKARAMLPDALAAYSRAHELAPGAELCLCVGVFGRQGKALTTLSFPRPPDSLAQAMRAPALPWPRCSPTWAHASRRRAAPERRSKGVAGSSHCEQMPPSKPERLMIMGRRQQAVYGVPKNAPP